MRVCFLGSPRSVIAPLKRLLASDHEVVAVVSQPAKPAGRKRVLTDPPVATYCKENNLKILQPDSVNISEFLAEFDSLNVDVAITAAFGQILSEKFLAVPRRATINIHPSLLPKYRGATPVPAALLAGDKVTGVSVLFTVKALDAGAVIVKEEVAIDPQETAFELTDRLFEVGGRLTLEALAKLEDPSYVGDEQDESKVSFCKKISKADALCDFDLDAETLVNRFRAFQPWPGFYSNFDSKRVQFCRMNTSTNSVSLEPGAFVFDQTEKAILCGAKDSCFEIKSLKPAGGREMKAGDFWNGVKDKSSSPKFDCGRS